MTAEDASTHDMVAGLHRRLDSWDKWREDVDGRLDAGEARHAESDKRMSLLEQEMVNSRKAGDRVYGHFVESFSRIEKAQEKANQLFSDHDKQGHLDRASTVNWLRGTFVVVVLSMAGLIVTLLSQV